MRALKEKYQTEITEKLSYFDESETKEILNFIKFLEKEKKKQVYLSTYKELKKEFQEKLTLKDALDEIEDYRSGR
jgi:phage-related tail protein